jgi:hypothetical protein
LSGRAGATAISPATIRPADAEYPYRPGDVLHRLLAQILQHDPQLVAHCARDEDRARLGEGLQARRDVDAVTVDVLTFDDDVSEIDADPELDAAFVERGAVTVGHAGLDRDCAGKIHQQPVAGALDDASAVRGDTRFDELAEMRLEPAKRAFLVEAHESAVADDVSRQDRCEFAFGALVFHRIARPPREPASRRSGQHDSAP